MAGLGSGRPVPHGSQGQGPAGGGHPICLSCAGWRQGCLRSTRRLQAHFQMCLLGSAVWLLLPTGCLVLGSAAQKGGQASGDFSRHPQLPPGCRHHLSTPSRQQVSSREEPKSRLSEDSLPASPWPPPGLYQHSSASVWVRPKPRGSRSPCLAWEQLRRLSLTTNLAAGATVTFVRRALISYFYFSVIKDKYLHLGFGSNV